MAASSTALREYHRKRDFEQTQEPRGGAKAAAGESRFVIQKHDASRLHYDFRLEIAGTLKSWAAPKGIPFKKGEKRLAVQVEDHPIEYIGFEGIIPKGEYGGGTVMVWDAGEFESLGSPDPLHDWEGGKLHFLLHGHKLDGEWTLVRMPHEDGKEWLLIKTGAGMKPLSKQRDDESSLTGRTMAKIAEARDAEWRSKPRQKPSVKARPSLGFVEPMKATLVEAPPSDPAWSYELKFDGYRALAVKNGSEFALYSRNQKDLSARFPEIRDALAGLPCDYAILDGEIVALADDGRSAFQLLQQLDTGAERPPLIYYLFDLLHENGRDFLNEPLATRRERLKALVTEVADPIRFSASLGNDAKRLLAEVKRRGLEGIIGKRTDSKYEPGRRSRAWIKIKCVHEQEFVIGGYTPPAGARKHFGALLAGVYHGKELRFAGKVGTGFTSATLALLHQKMEALAQSECPFANLPEKGPQGRWSQNITPREMKLCRWVQPQMVCQVRFTEWTEDGKLRHPSFLGLREDKPPEDVVREAPSHLDEH